MSCFQVSDAHIDALVQARNLVNKKAFAHLCDKMTDVELGRWLVRANMESVFARYNGRHDSAVNEAEIAAYEPGPRRAWTIVELLKAVHVYAYQANEIRDWEASDVRRFCEELTALLIPCLPEWDALPWGIPTSPLPEIVR
jgi:hypothetical protein